MEKPFEGPQFCRTLKEAEHAAAKVALMSLSDDGSEEDGASFFKNLLQDFCVKEGLPVLFYKTVCSGASHNPTFFSTVELQDDTFQGMAAKTKKQAEINAAKVAYSCLKEYGDEEVHLSGSVTETAKGSPHYSVPSSPNLSSSCSTPENGSKRQQSTLCAIFSKTEQQWFNSS